MKEFKIITSTHMLVKAMRFVLSFSLGTFVFVSPLFFFSYSFLSLYLGTFVLHGSNYVLCISRSWNPKKYFKRNDLFWWSLWMVEGKEGPGCSRPVSLRLVPLDRSGWRWRWLQYNNDGNNGYAKDYQVLPLPWLISTCFLYMVIIIVLSSLLLW